MKISYIIRFTNGEDNMQACLDSILDQKGDFNNEFIFVNDNTTDQTIDYVKSLKTSPPPKTEIKIVNLEPGSFTYASAINTGLKEVTGDFVSIVTVHTVLKNVDAMQNMIANFSDSEVLGVYPRIIAASGTGTLAKLTKKGTNITYKIVRSKKYFTQDGDADRIGNYGFQTSFCCIRADLFKENVNRFHELPRSEDLEWSYRMISNGNKIVFDPSAIVFHQDHDTITQIAKRWLTAVTAIILIKTKKVPSRFALLKSTLVSFIPFLLTATLKTKGIPGKLKHVGYLFKGVFFIKKECFFNYNYYKNWENRYNESLNG